MPSTRTTLRTYTLVTATLALTSMAGRSASAIQDSQPPPIAGQVTFLYYNDLERASEFYRETLGLENTLDLDWVKMYQLSPTSKVGLVSATGGTHRPSSDKPVMLSMVVERPGHVDAWYKRLRNRGVEITSEPHDSERSGVRSFGFKDSEGYTLEIFSWLEQ